MAVPSSFVKHVLEIVQGSGGAAQPMPGIPPDVSGAISDAAGQAGDAAGVTDRLAGLYQSTFGSSAYGEGPLAVVPVGPQQGGGGGVSVGAVAIIGLLGVGGYMLYKKMKGGAA
jgi:hypothetical protein